MARPTLPRPAQPKVEQVSGNQKVGVVASVAIHRPGKKTNARTETPVGPEPWQTEVYRHVGICGEARYAATLFSNMAGRAEIGVSKAQTKVTRAAWVDEGVEVDILNEIASTVRERSKLIRDFMLHFVLVGECYLIARTRQPQDPHPEKVEPIWEIVSVTELRKTGTGEHAVWQVRYDNDEYIDLDPDDPILRLWNPDPENRRKPWSPYKALLPTLREIEHLTQHIFTQVRSRLMSAGIWFLPDNMTFPAPPPEAVQGGETAIASMNEAEKFMTTLAAASMEMLEADEVAFPTVVLADTVALDAIDKGKLIQFWSEIDDKAMVLRSDAVRRFALGMDLPPEQVLGSSGLAVTGAGGSAGSVNHWGVWANEEQTISTHIEPALDVFVGTLTAGLFPEGSVLVLAYDTATLRLRQDRSKEAIELFDRGLLKGEIALRENGFDPDTDSMDSAEHRTWLLNRLAGGSATPEQVQAAFVLLGIELPVSAPPVSGNPEPAPGQPGRNEPRNLDDHPYEGPPRVNHEHKEAEFQTLLAASEVLVLRALEKAGTRLLNDGKRGKDRDRATPKHLAHVTAAGEGPITSVAFDFDLADTVFGHLPAARRSRVVARLDAFCHGLYATRNPYTRKDLHRALGGV